MDYGDVQSVSHEEIQAAADLLLSQPHYEAGQLTELVRHWRDFTVADQKRVLQLMERWHQTEGTDETAEKIRDALRRYVLARSDTPDDIRLMVEALCDRLASDDEILRNAWLFGGFWDVEGNTEASVADWPRRLERHQAQQTEIVGAVYERYGLTGLWQLAEKAEDSKEVGAAVARAAWPLERLAEFVAEATSGRENRGQVVTGWMEGEPRARVADVLRLVQPRVTAETFQALLLQAPFVSDIWQLLAMNDALAKAYWAAVKPQSPFPGEEAEAVQLLMTAGRPWAAFEAIQWAPERLDASLLVALLRTMADGEVKPHPTIWERQIREAVKTAEEGDTLTADEKAQLEWLWLPVMGCRWMGDKDISIPWLERYVHRHPVFFARTVEATFYRDDGTRSSSGLDAEAEERQRRRGQCLFRSLTHLPGSDETGDEQQKALSKWLEAARKEVQSRKVSEAADRCIGTWLARAPVDEDGVWPAVWVCEALEPLLPLQKLSEAVISERWQALGAHWIDEKGTASRSEGERYREWAERRAEMYPRLTAQILLPLAERFMGQADAEGARVVSQRRIYR